MTTRIRVDDDAANKLEDLVDDIGGTKSGVASEALRIGIAQLKEDGHT